MYFYVIWRLFLWMIQNDAHGKVPPLADPALAPDHVYHHQHKTGSDPSEHKQSHPTVSFLKRPPDLTKETTPNHFLVHPSA